MWLEIKAAFTIIGSLVIGINFIFAPMEFFIKFLVYMVGVLIIITGDVVYGMKVINTDAVNLIDVVSPGEKVAAVEDVGGNYRFIRAKVGMLGKLEFMLKKNKAGIIDDGTAQKRLPNGNPMIFGHVLYDKNINPVKAKYFEEVMADEKIGNVKELYGKLIKKDKEDTHLMQDEPYQDIAQRVDEITVQKDDETEEFNPADFSPELKNTEENLRFIKKIKDYPIPKKMHEKTIFFYEVFDPAIQVFADNIWNRSIFVVDKLCDMFFAATLEQQNKYVKRKRPVGFNMVFLLILLLGGIGVIMVIFFLLTMMGVI